MPKKKEYNINLKPDDILFFYTDGITEAMNENKELFGEKRLKFFLDRLTEINSASKMLTAIDENVKKYVGSAPQSDDMTMLGLIYKKAG
ncbi:MAG: SpoIIE family protein phosphatase [Candidatus Riflebacteria bacterium]|nr:SpoIIE family protein phosphatase [Candidatus Riflebacteria bacterium]